MQNWSLTLNKRGRPPQHEIDVIKTMVWFNAVSRLTGGLSADALEEQFDSNKPSKVAGTSGPHNNWRTWKNGEIVVSLATVERIETEVNGSKKWFVHPLWGFLKNPGVLKSTDEIDNLLWSLQDIKYYIFEELHGQRHTWVRVFRPFGVDCISTVCCLNETKITDGQTIYLLSTYDDLDCFTANLVYAIEASFMRNLQSKTLALNEYHASKPRIRRLLELSNVCDRLFTYIDSLPMFAYPQPSPQTETEYLLEQINALFQEHDRNDYQN